MRTGEPPYKHVEPDVAHRLTKNPHNSKPDQQAIDKVRRRPPLEYETKLFWMRKYQGRDGFPSWAVYARNAAVIRSLQRLNSSNLTGNYFQPLNTHFLFPLHSALQRAYDPVVLAANGG